MQTHRYNDFDAFAESIRHIDSRMSLRHPKNRTWSISSVDLIGVTLQTGQLGSGNIAMGESPLDGCMIYLQLRTLNQVHRALKAADPKPDLVSEIVMAHGVWEFGGTIRKGKRSLL